MYPLIEIKYIRNVALLIVIGAMIWQQWKTFKKYEEGFMNPVKYTEKYFGKDYITGYGKRYDEIKKMFPSTGHICYLGEAGDDFPTWSANYSLTQYNLGPSVFMKNKMDCDTILYNLHWSIGINPKTNYHLNNGWHIVKDFNNGLVILAK